MRKIAVFFENGQGVPIAMAMFDDLRSAIAYSEDWPGIAYIYNVRTEAVHTTGTGAPL